MQLFQHLNQQQQTILMVTHSTIDASYANRVVLLKMVVYIMRYTVEKRAR